MFKVKRSWLATDFCRNYVIRGGPKVLFVHIRENQAGAPMGILLLKRCPIVKKTSSLPPNVEKKKPAPAHMVKRGSHQRSMVILG